VLLACLGIYLLHYTNQQNLAIRYLYERNSQLEQDNQKVTELQNELKYLEAERTKMALILGADKNPPPIDLANLQTEYKPYQPPETTLTARFQVAPTTGYILSRGVSATHNGLDFATQLGMPVFAVASGKVEDTGIDTLYGNYIKLDLGDGYKAFYGHLYKTIKVKDESVNAGDIIGYVGTSGKSSAPHLHFELWQIKAGKPLRLDPEKELKSILKPRINIEPAKVKNVIDEENQE
jgi:murein DD-endopeptidase MepM/ murein hydrolase activator NlpD